MDARERWQALQARLTAARAAVDAGDRATALAEISAALALDSEFLAAHAVRDRILAMADGPSPAAPASGPSSNAGPSSGAEPAQPRPSDSTPAAGLPPGYAKFEQRARRRRVDRRIDAARAAIQEQRVKAAASALDEVIELDPNLPELVELTAQFDALRRAAATTHVGPRIAAAAVFVGAVLGGTWLQDSSPLLSRQIVAAAPLPAPVMPILTATEEVTVVGTTGTTAARERGVTAVPSDAAPRAVELPAALSPGLLRVPTAPVEAAPAARPVETPHATAESAVVAPIAMVVPPRVDMPDDNVLVKQALQRYRSAYEGLDAQSAQAVWPAVNQPALARAFDGLESQSLTFDACDVRLRGEAATATCHGTTRYVTKVGSRDPRVEPRVWNFTLRKAGSDWKIDTARAER